MWILFAVTLTNRSGTMFLPFLVLYLTRHLGFTAPEAGLQLAIYGAAALVASPLSGRLADRLGADRVMRTSLFVSGLLLVLFPLVKTHLGVGLFAVALSFGQEAFRPASLSIITHLVRPEQRKAAFALSRLAVNLGMSVGPAAGGFIAIWSWPALFWVDGATSLLAGLVLVLSPLHLPAYTAGPAPEGSAPATSPFTDRVFLLFLAGVVPVGIVFFQHASAMSVFLVRDLGFATSVYGLLQTVNTLLIVFTEVPLNLAFAGWPHRRTLATGCILVGLGFGIFAVARSLPAIVVGVVVWTLGEMILLPGMAAFVAGIAPERGRGAWMGVYTMSFNLSFAVGPWLGNWMLDRYGPTILWGTMFAFGLASAAIMSRVPEPRAS